MPGMDITLETRTCACGCARTFRCLPSSPAKYASKSCEFGGDIGKIAASTGGKRRGRPPGPTPKPKPRAEIAPVLHVVQEDEDMDDELTTETDDVEETELVQTEEAVDAGDDVEAEAESETAAVDGPELGTYESGDPFCVDIEKLISTRLLVTASSGGGKSWLLRKLIEETQGKVQQIVFDPEGEFKSLTEAFDIDHASANGPLKARPSNARKMALNALKTGRSLIMDLYELERDDRIQFVGTFLDAMMNAPKAHWRKVLVIVDEAHIFNPDKATKIKSAKPMIDLATRGRKRGFSIVLATQRLSKLHKDTVAELLNKLVGRIQLDIDLKRAGDELGLRDPSELRSLRPGQFYAYGPAFGESVELATIGDVQTEHGVVDAGDTEEPEEETTVGRKQIACSVCGETGHNKKTCSEAEAPKKKGGVDERVSQSFRASGTRAPRRSSEDKPEHGGIHRMHWRAEVCPRACRRRRADDRRERTQRAA